MAEVENRLTKLVLLRASEMGARLFRQNVGQSWIGSQTVRTSAKEGRNIRLLPGDVLIRNARPFHSGLGRGSSDMVGWKPVEITPDMVGQRVAVFVALEAKGPKGKVTPEQERFLRAVEQAGGLAGVVREETDADQLLA